MVLKKNTSKSRKPEISVPRYFHRHFSKARIKKKTQNPWESYLRYLVKKYIGPTGISVKGLAIKRQTSNTFRVTSLGEFSAIGWLLYLGIIFE
jgi:hypothetical protein